MGTFISDYTGTVETATGIFICFVPSRHGGPTATRLRVDG